MQDNAPKTFEGLFRIECLDKDDNIIDFFEDHNTIMHSARRSMAEIFFNKNNNKKKFANRFVIGTEGQTITNFIPKTENDGFTKDKQPQSLYSEEGYTKHNILSIIYIKKFQVILVNNEFYRYIGDNTNILLKNDVLEDTSKFIKCGKPYTYKIDFDIAKGNSEIVNDSSNALNLAIGQSLENRCGAFIRLSDDNDDVLDNSTCIFTFEIPMDQANGQHNATESSYSNNISVFTEACIYVNDRIFSMKCFPCKIKDDTTKFRVIWKILF